MTTSAEQMRQWKGPALLSFGFRPFFLLGAIWAALSMLLWVLMLAGALELPTALDPVSWHAHALLFGYLPAIAAGFMLTAVPNWTGRLPVTGWPLGLLALLWLAGQAAVMTSALWPAEAVALADLSAPVALAVMMGREIIAGKNWRNLIVLAMLAALIAANALFHAEAALGAYAAQGYGIRLGLSAGILMIAVIGGRIVPSFTRNWLAKQGQTARPAPPMQRFDKIALLAAAAALLSWTVVPESPVTGAALLAAGLLHAARLARWSGLRTRGEPLVLVLHGAYAFVPLGALALGAAVLWPGTFPQAAAQHIWMAGAIGLMTLAVMTRATLGHTGRALTAGTGTAAVFLLLTASVACRLAAAIWPDAASLFLQLSAAGWIAAFGGFTLLFGPMLARPRPAL